MASPGIAFERKEKEEGGWARGWRYTRVAWCVARNIIFIFLVLAAFGKMKTDFEVIVLAALLLILQTASYSNTIFVRQFCEYRLQLGKEVQNMYRKFSKEWTSDDERKMKETEEEFRENVRTYEKTDTFYAINSVGNLIVYVITLFKIFSVVVLS